MNQNDGVWFEAPEISRVVIIIKQLQNLRGGVLMKLEVRTEGKHEDSIYLFMCQEKGVQQEDKGVWNIFRLFKVMQMYNEQCLCRHCTATTFHCITSAELSVYI